ncbi:hypothetical protein BCV72DRAFT_316366 [Rhizopus microsporus var. microsporus]|uniref:Uncharacterized protein n=1 Tax=Rhizopus microsporus var. microsporus TaxID=86635 RepID=A0A1X0RDH5_RHIZD|nr:hypothetical protein BCV72DRAFT_316366 [Rhizopus microsporus var. microsporus]
MTIDNLHISCTGGWSKVGEPAKIVDTKNKGNTITILGAISSQDVINISLRKPIVGTTAKIGMRAEHFLSYLGNMMNVLDKNELKGC